MPNRQEVAKKLREVSTARTTDEVYVALLNCMGITYDYANLFNQLADLIDPTCEGIYRREPDDIDGTPRYTIHCSNCGQLLDETSGIPHSPMYCHNCGTRIIRGCLYSQSEDRPEVVRDES